MRTYKVFFYIVKPYIRTMNVSGKTKKQAEEEFERRTAIPTDNIVKTIIDNK